MKRFNSNKVFATAISNALLSLYCYAPYAAELNTRLPAEQESILTAPVIVDSASQPLGSALREFAKKADIAITFDSDLTLGKTAPAVKGSMSRKDALRRLLNNSGLEAQQDGNTVYIKRPLKRTESQEIKLDKVVVRAKRFHEIGPLPGLGLTKEEIPGNVQSISAKEIKESHSLSLTDLMNKKLQSVNVNDYQGNPFQMDVTYRGFTAGPQIGTPQGLSVFFDGIRVNEPFGDVVNWDMMPMNAIAGVDVFPGSNPIFGLNTLGGAFTLKTKDGFTNEGVDAEILAGSYGRKQLQVEGGINNGEFALFGAGNFFLEDGWRQNSPSKVNQYFGKGSYRGEKLDLSLSTLLVQTDLVGNGLLPSEMYAQNRRDVYSSPDTTKNRLAQFQLSGAFQVNDNFSITGQAYRRNSKRHSVGADVFTDYDPDLLARRKPTTDPLTGEIEQYTCLLDSTNKFGLPDYYVLTLANLVDGESEIFNNAFYQDSQANGYVGNINLDLASQPPEYTTEMPVFNADMPAEIAAYFLAEFRYSANKYQDNVVTRNSPPILPPADAFQFNGAGPHSVFGSGSVSVGLGNSVLGTASQGDFYYFSNEDNIPKKHYIFFISPKNNDKCLATKSLDVASEEPAFSYADPNGGPFPTTVDGIATGQKGVAIGTPTAIFNDNNINQIVDGASIQFNWNLEHHKFMMGASIDAADATYSNTAQLGFLDENRKAYLDPAQAMPQFAGARGALPNNDFSGSNITKSIYFSETWTPLETWHFNASGRYNETQAKNKIAARYGLAAYSVGDLKSLPDEIAICPNRNCTGVATGYKLPDLTKSLDAAETEKFSYYSFNPSLGLTWQAKENLNIFANWAKGARTPSVIELGCALDKTLVDAGYNNLDGTPAKVFKSIKENRQCTLPTTLSGDPYLKQIKATTYDIGMRGSINSLLGAENVQWNLGAYQTDLKDDIYFISSGNSQGFFDNVGKTRRRGIEAGISGKKDKLSISLNYGLTDATFQDSFTMLNQDNSSSFVYDAFYGLNAIRVKQGDRMPGVPLHNLNATVSYDVTPKWQIGLSAVVHSTSYLRGNENNEHKKGVTQYRTIRDPTLGEVRIPLQPTNNPGSVPGYATFNFQTSYKFNQEWTASMLVNNLLDKEYFSAGRLGRSPFSPNALGGVAGEIGIDGYNHNSGNWLSTNFIAPSAPRGIWFSLNWQFDGKKDKVASDSATLTEPSEVEKPYQPLPPSLHRYQGTPQVEE